MRLSSRSVLTYIIATNLFKKEIHSTCKAFHLNPSFVGKSSQQVGQSFLPKKGYRNNKTSMRMMATTSSSSTGVPGRVALLQFSVTYSKDENHKKASEFIAKAAKGGAQLLVLPEIWNSPYATAAFSNYAEKVPDVGEQPSDESPSIAFLVEQAKRHSVYIVGGSIPEISQGGNIYNTCICVDPSGNIVAKHRKVHLFDVDVPGGIRFKESDTLSPGNEFTCFNAGELFGNVGVGLCYDIRFPEYALVLCKKHNCNIIAFPGAFNLTTGPAHWELLQRGRAVDNQCFVLTAAPARTEPPTEEGKYPHYSSWGHSTAVSPWGDVIATCDENENVVFADLDMGQLTKMRQGIPTLQQKRIDMYQVDETEN